MNKPEYDFVFEPVRREIVACPECDGKTHPGDGHGGCSFCRDEAEFARLVVASEEEWTRFKIACYASDYKYQTLKILIKAEVLFSGDEPFHNENGVVMPSRVQQRLFKTLEGTQAELYWWLGESIGNFKLWIVSCGCGIAWGHRKDWLSEIHIGTNKANEPKLESLTHLVKGWWTE